MAIEAGTLVTPAVRLVRPIAAGGMGTVWVADHLTLHTQVAVKIMAAELTKNPEVAQRFTREAAASARVKSPHVVQVLDHGVTGDEQLPFIVMELLEGRDLGSLIAAGQPLELELVAQIIIQISKALARAHAAGVVHRDIKPDNIFVCDTDGGEAFVKLLDFGIAKNDAGPALHVTAPGAVFGTPLFMSPEQLVGEPVDARTDLWSLGVVAFRALTATLPYDGETMGAVAIAAHAPLPAPSSRNPALPAWVDAWFAKACAKDPDQRFENASEMGRFVSAALGETPKHTALPSAPLPVLIPRESNTVAPSSQEPPRTGSGAKWGAIVAAVAVIGALAFVLVRRDPPPPAPALPPPLETPSAAAPASAPSAVAELPAISPSSLPLETPPSVASTPSHRARPPSKSQKKPTEYDDIK